MCLDEEAQEDLGAIVQSCLDAIDDTRGSQSSVVSESDMHTDTIESHRSVTSSIDAEEIRLPAAMEARLQKDMKKQAIYAEKEADRLRQKNALLD